MNVFAAKELEAADLLALARLDDDGAPPAVTPPPARDGRGRHAIPFAGTVARVREALRAQGFGVLTEIDVQATLRDKLGVNMEPYLVLGACNPSLAHQALSTGRRIGLLLPLHRGDPDRGQPDRDRGARPAADGRGRRGAVAPAVAGQAATRLRAASDTLREADLAVPPAAGSPSLACRKGTKDLVRHDHRTC